MSIAWRREHCVGRPERNSSRGQCVDKSIHCVLLCAPFSAAAAAAAAATTGRESDD